MPAPTIRRCLADATLAGTLLAVVACAPWPTAVGQATGSGGEPVTIDMAGAQAGGITRGDAPGFPVTLNAPGHYRLTGDLVVPAGQAGVVIAAAGVTLDLNGFSIRAVTACAAHDATCRTLPQAGVDGVHVRAQGMQATVRNGAVRGFAGTGVVVDTEARVEDLEISENSAGGLHANTSATRPVQIRRVAALRNGSDGFWLQTGSVTHSRADGNGRHGFALGALMQWEECSAQGNRDVDGDILPAQHHVAATQVPEPPVPRQRGTRNWLARIATASAG